jgi:hypothetical protein
MASIIVASTAFIVLVVLIRRLSLGQSGDVQLSKATIETALYRLGDEAADAGETVTLIVVGGTAMVLGYQARQSTRDVDAYFRTPPARAQTRQWSAKVAHDLNLPADWLNDGAKGFMQGVAQGPLLLQGRGIMVYQVAPEQLLAMKLAAWRDERDRNDAAIILQTIRYTTSDKDAVWKTITPFLTPFDILKASYAFADLWENLDAKDV